MTGSTRGIGLALARALGRAGARVVVHGRDAERAGNAAATLRGESIVAESVAWDLRDGEKTLESVEHVRARVGAIDILVNNAGFIRRTTLLDLDLENWGQTFDVNVTGAMLVSRAVVPDMIEAGTGKIINVSSVLGRVARAEAGAYAITKAALTMLTQTMCAEWARYGIQANAIAPGYVRTDLTRELADSPDFEAWLAGRVPAGRWGQPSDLEGAVVFLAGAGSAFVNGHVLAVDGGLLAVI